MITYWRGRQLRAIRKGPWKAHLATKTEYLAKEVVLHDPPLLFNLETDPSEKYDVAAEHPEIAAQLKAEAEAFAASFEPPPSQLDLFDPKPRARRN